MLNINEFRKYGHQFVDWMADFYENIEDFPVKSHVKPREIYDQIPENPPQQGESMDVIFNDFQKIILPGMTHWQSPNFYAYFNANASFPSILGEMLSAALGAQCMKWETSPAATELEEKVTDWLKEILGLPVNFHGVIHDTGSTSTLCAVLTAREKYSGYQVNKQGVSSFNHLRFYCSTHTHSSVEKAIRIAGIGSENLVLVETDDQFRLKPGLLEQAIENDKQNGEKPCCVIATLGTTSSTAIDPLEKIAKICAKFNVWLHVDAAQSGSALALPEYRWMIKGIEQADTFFFNPHKWLFTNFDCSVYYAKDKEALLKTFQMVPEYLKTKSDNQVNNYCDWGIQLGRRFRGLKLWFVLRNFGVEGLQQKIRFHISLAKKLEEKIKNDPDFELTAPRSVNLVCFRFKPTNLQTDVEINKLNEKLLHELNGTGKVYLTHTKLNGKYTLRMVTGQTNLKEKHVDAAWALIKECAGNL